ncbi:PREDICTED: glucan endo-1,3-beta-glucosidase 12 [Tarenaya hassleriana]|uniref:glucan endo-1,3-beta-glucosidase 12 n=1 Tax=Tarenaya hassleriana TaxID=28532 RepID=UPI00053C10AD|nr:PREDICTED: glucan endo-1,3-beta-glucosidase 12 [Tarenaya hassleriana]
MGRKPWMLIFSVCVLSLVFLDLSSASTIGICYGRNADNLPSPDRVSELIQQLSIKYVRIYDANIDVLKAFSNTGVELMIGVPNSDLLAFSQFQSNVDSWLKNNILPYYPATKINYISVGLEVTEAPDNATGLVVPAMRNIHTALRKAGLDKKIKVSSSHSLAVLSRSFPPSSGAFGRKHEAFLKPMLEFLAENDSPFMIDLYPYYAFRDSGGKVPLEYALFQSSSQVVDPSTGLLYTNMFDAQLDAIYFALTAMNFRTIKVMVTESGWPTKGSPRETAATPENAVTYNTNLIRHVIGDSGTPAKPGEEIDVYVFSLFNENRKPGIESERNWGLYYPNGSSIYKLDFTGKDTTAIVPPTNSSSSGPTNPTPPGGGIGTNITTIGSAKRWCIASSQASETDLQSGLDWACGPGNVDCSAIQESQPCFEPDTVLSHASYAFNTYFQQNGATDIACNFSGIGVLIDRDPSYDNCLYMIAPAITGLNKTLSGNITAIDSPMAAPTSSSEAFRQRVSIAISVFLSCIVTISFRLSNSVALL